MDSWNAAQPLSVFGGAEGNQQTANVPISGFTGGFSYTPGSVTISGDKISTGGGLQFDLPVATIQAFTHQALSFSSNNSALNRGFLGGVIDKQQTALGRVQAGAMSNASSMISNINYLADQQRTANYKLGRRASGGCFITTAVCEAEGLADDCEMLTDFRAFRDNVMLADNAGKNAVAYYYEIAPAIVEKIKARKDAARIFESLKIRFLIPAQAAIKSGDNDKAKSLYYGLVVAAKTMAGV